MEWFINAIARRLTNRARQHHRHDIGDRWDGLKEADVVDSVQSVLRGLGLEIWREYAYPVGGGFADIVTESWLPGHPEPERWVEVKSLVEGDNRLGQTRFDPEMGKDFSRLASLPSGMETIVVWAMHCCSGDAATAGGASAARYTLQQAVDRIRLLYGVSPISMASFDVSQLVATTPTARHLHVVIWHRPATAPPVVAA